MEHPDAAEAHVYTPEPSWSTHAPFAHSSPVVHVAPFGLFGAVLAAVRRARPVALYLHPRECAPEPVRLRLGRVAEFITYTGLAGVPRKLERLLERHRSQPMREVLAAEGHLPPG